jgi:hypothetical protein
MGLFLALRSQFHKREATKKEAARMEEEKTA